MKHKATKNKTGRWLAIGLILSVSLVGLVGMVSGLQLATIFEGVALSNDSGTYEELQKLFIADGAAGDQFGTFVAMDGEFAVVSAYRETIDGNEDEGAVYVYRRTAVVPENWELVTKLTADDGTAVSWFGVPVGISGEYIAVGAPFALVDGVAGVPGAVYLFKRNEGGPDNWGQIAKLAADDAADGDWFGHWLSIEDSYLVVGATTADINSHVNQGAAYVFQQQSEGSNNWNQVQKLTGDTTVDDSGFGFGIALAGDTLVIGSNNAAYVFQHELGIFTQTQILTVTNPIARFGESVAVMGNTIVVGAPYEQGLGAAYLFERNIEGSGDWVLRKTVTGDGTNGNDAFGSTVSIWEDTVVIGARSEDAAYVFSRDAEGIDNWGQVGKLTASDNVLGKSEHFGFGTAVQGETAFIGAQNTTIGENARQGAAYVFHVAPTYNMTVAKSDAGTGTITSSFPGIECGITCTAEFPIGEVVTLTAVPDADSIFNGWSGDCTGLAECVITMTQTKQITASFGVSSYEVIVAKSGTGTGSITSNLPGIACGFTCTAEFPIGTVVTLTAVADADSFFEGWSGACVEMGDCMLTITQTQQVTATFTTKFKAYLPAILKE